MFPNLWDGNSFIQLLNLIKISICSKCLMKGSGGMQSHMPRWVSHCPAQSPQELYHVPGEGGCETCGDVALGCSPPQTLCCLPASWRTPGTQNALRLGAMQLHQYRVLALITEIHQKRGVEVAGTIEIQQWSMDKGNEVVCGATKISCLLKAVFAGKRNWAPWCKCPHTLLFVQAQQQTATGGNKCKREEI